jgi:hypothetical protein
MSDLENNTSESAKRVHKLTKRPSRKEFANVSDVLNKVSHNLGLDKRLHEHSLISMWPTLVGAPVARRSRPLYIDAERNYVVAVADAALAQELSLLKTKILSRLIPTGRALGVTIKGMRFDLKNFHTPSVVGADENFKPRVPTDEDLDNVALSDQDLSELAKVRAELDLETQPVGDRILHVFEKELRLRRWRFVNGFPCCGLCGNPVERLHQLKDPAKPVYACATCYFGRS